jgi:hypothetical protein
MPQICHVTSSHRIASHIRPTDDIPDGSNPTNQWLISDTSIMYQPLGQTRGSIFWSNPSSALAYLASASRSRSRTWAANPQSNHGRKEGTFRMHSSHIVHMTIDESLQCKSCVWDITTSYTHTPPWDFWEYRHVKCVRLLKWFGREV